MLPKKLKDDSIIEALCELQFRTAEVVPEIVVGRLSDLPPWKLYTKSVLPLSNIPPTVRRTERDLMYAPYIQLRSPDGSRLVQIGENVLSYHAIGKYCGWTNLQPELQEAIGAIFEKIEDITITRLGFRYINALTAVRHYVSGVRDLNLDIRVANEMLDTPLNLNYEMALSESHIVQSRIATPKYVRGDVPLETSLVVDIDVYTPPEYETKKINEVFSWVDKAHDFEKEAFFKLLPQPLQEKLKEE